MITVQTRNMHCCGTLEIVGMNEKVWTPLIFIKGLVKAVQSYKTPHKGQMCYAGYAFYFLTFAYYNSARLRAQDDQWYREPEGRERYERLQIFLEKHDLGTLTMTEDAPSGTYGGKHMLRAAVYMPNNKNLVKFARKRKWIPAKWAKLNKPPGVVVWG